MSKYLYIDGACGISGDMTVAALLDLGASREKLDKALASLRPFGEFSYSVTPGNSYSIAGCCFNVHLPHEETPHEEHYHHHHHHRHLNDVLDILQHVQMNERARKKAEEIFRYVAQAEAKAHGCSLEDVHFHEVGAMDSLADIVGAATLADDLEVDGCIVTSLRDGQGTVMCQHGELPVPVPAVLNIAEASGISLQSSHTQGEMITPTGIAIAAALRTHDHLPETYRVLRSGIGLGKRDFGRANFLRLQLIEDVTPINQVYELAANIDDSTPEELGFLMERLFNAGALDAWYTPCVMKKGRPAVTLGVLVKGERLEDVQNCVLEHSSSIGLRYCEVQRTTMQRETIRVNLPYGEVQVKHSTLGGITRYSPEYESMKALALTTGRSLRSIYDDVMSQIRASET